MQYFTHHVTCPRADFYPDRGPRDYDPSGHRRRAVVAPRGRDVSLSRPVFFYLLIGERRTGLRSQQKIDALRGEFHEISEVLRTSVSRTLTGHVTRRRRRAWIGSDKTPSAHQPLRAAGFNYFPRHKRCLRRSRGMWIRRQPAC